MASRITYEQVSVDYSAIARAVGRDASAMPRQRPRAPQKAALLRRLGIEPEQIGPVSARRFASVQFPARTSGSRSGR